LALPIVVRAGETHLKQFGLMVFVRDTTGRVTHYIARTAGGPLIIARRIR
jgi:hypothetical protein